MVKKSSRKRGKPSEQQIFQYEKPLCHECKNPLSVLEEKIGTTEPFVGMPIRICECKNPKCSNFQQKWNIPKEPLIKVSEEVSDETLTNDD